MTSLQLRIEKFLETPPPGTLISLGESATKDILVTFATSGALTTSQVALLELCIASNVRAGDEAEREEEKCHFATTSGLLSEIKAEVSAR